METSYFVWRLPQGTALSPAAAASTIGRSLSEPMESAAAAQSPQDGQAAGQRGRRGAPLPLRPRGGFGAYLHELRGERGLTVRELAAAAGVHHTYVSKLERGDRQAPDDAVVEALAAALGATPAQLDQMRWRAGLTPRGGGAPGQDDPTLTLVAEALGDTSLPAQERDRLRRTIAQVVGTAAPAAAPEARDKRPEARGSGRGAGISGAARAAAAAGAGGYDDLGAFFQAPRLGPAGPSPAPEPAPDGRAAVLAGLMGGWQTLDEAAAELRVTPAYVWSLVQSGRLRAWALPGAPAGSPAGVRLRREDLLALLQPVTPVGTPFGAGDERR